MSGMDLGIRIFFGVLMLVIFLVHLYCLIYAWKHFRDPQEFANFLKDAEWERKKRKMRENRSIDKALWGDYF